MTIIKVPTDVAVSPENGSQIRFDTDTQLVFDEVGNSWPVGDPVPNRNWNEASKWARENYPLNTGDSE